MKIKKIHYSQQAVDKKIGSHSDSISINQFLSLYEMLGRSDIDIMLEVKDKNLSCIKCINCTFNEPNINALNKEWRKYKYIIMERSYFTYYKINELLEDKKEISPIYFYELIELGMKGEGDSITSINTAFHVWCHLKNDATDKEMNHFFEYIK